MPVHSSSPNYNNVLPGDQYGGMAYLEYRRKPFLPVRHSLWRVHGARGVAEEQSTFADIL